MQRETQGGIRRAWQVRVRIAHDLRSPRACASVRTVMPLRAAIAVILTSLLSSGVTAAPPLVAKFSTIVGDFDVLLHENAAPLSVANFTSYANSGRYDSTIIHRSTTYDPHSIQIVQGGGFVLSTNSLSMVVADQSIALEAGLANSRGTLAMARTSDPDSATSQWFLNVADNPGLDGNYAVFGDMISIGGLSVLNALGAVPAYDASGQLGGVFNELPLTQPALESQYLVVVHGVSVTPFQITAIRPGTNGVHLDWTALSTNTPVKVERTTNLAAGNWQVVSSNNTQGTFTDTNAPATAFYRLVTQ